MASFYSKPTDYGTYTQPINLELLNFVMESRQQKYDYNLAKIESKVAEQLGSLDLVRAEDKEYFMNRASQVLGSMGNLSNVDWSKNGVTKQIDSQINSVVDDRVLNNVLSTKNYRNFQRTLQQKQEKGDGTYNVRNAAYAMETQGVNAWLRGESDNIGSINYQDYHDVGEELRDISENLDKYATNIKRIDGNAGDMYFVSTQGKRLTSAEVRNIAENLLSDNAKQQMKINGWANYDGGARTAEEITGQFIEGVYNPKKEYYEDKIKIREEKIKNLNGTKPEQAEQLKSEITQLKNAQQKTLSQFNSWIDNGNTSNMTNMMERETVLQNFANTFAIENTVQEYIRNDYKYAEYQEELKRATALAVEKEKAARAVTTRKSGKNEGPGFQQVPSMQDQIEENPYDMLEDEIGNRQKGFDRAYSQLINQVPKDTMARLEKAYNDYVSKQDGTQKLPKKDWMVTTLKAMEDSEKGTVSSQAIAEADFALKILNGRVKDKIKYDRLAFEEEEARMTESFIEELTDKGGFFRSENNAVMVNEAGKVVLVRDYLKSNGINSAEDLEQNPETKRQFLKAYYADKISSDKQGPIGRAIDGALATPGATINAVKRLWSSIGDPVGTTAALIALPLETKAASEAENTLNAETYKERLIQLFEDDGMSREEAENQASQYFEKSLQVTNIQKKNSLATTASGGIAPETRGFYTGLAEYGSGDSFDAASVKRVAAKRMAEDKYTPVADALIFDTKQTAGEALVRLINSGEVFNPGGATINPSQPVTLRDNGDETVSARFMIRDKSTGQWGFKTAIIAKTQLPSEVTDVVDFDLTAPKIGYDDLDTFTSNVQMVDSNNTKRLADMAATIGIPYEAAQMLATPENVLGSLHREYPQLIGMPGQPNQLGLAIKDLLKSDRLDIKMEKNEDLKAFVPSLVYNDPGADEIKLVTLNPIPNDQLDYVYREVSYGAATKVGDFLRNALNTIILNGGASNPAIENIMKIYGRRAAAEQ